MNEIIRLLPESVANQIAAGEVVTEPAYLIKELVENSIDAGAKNIVVEIAGGGLDYVLVSDDGKGMSPIDARMAFSRHATSKIREFKDLQTVYTKGFRGEALAAISAVCHVELQTRREKEEVGTEIRISASVIESVGQCACKVGTTIKAKDMCYNQPVQRGFFIGSGTVAQAEIKHTNRCLREFNHICLVHPEIHFSVRTLRRDKSGNYVVDKEYEYPATKLKERILNVVDKKSLRKDLLDISFTTDFCEITGFIGRPDKAIQKPSQFLFVNNRFITHSSFHRAILEGYDQMLKEGQQPNYFIYITVPAQEVDINVHPKKTEVRFLRDSLISTIFPGLIRDTISSNGAIPSIDFDTEHYIDIPAYKGRIDIDISNFSYSTPVISTEGGSRSVIQKGFAGIKDLKPSILDNTDWESYVDQFVEDELDSTNEDQLFDDQTAPLPMLPTEMQQRQVVRMDFSQKPTNLDSFLYKGRYIITTLGRNLLLVDYQRAMTRVYYERYLEHLNEQKIEQQPLLFPQTIEFSHDDITEVRYVLDLLREYGFELEETEDETFLIQAVPAILSEDPTTVIIHLVDYCLAMDLSSEEKIRDLLAQEMARSFARHAEEPQGANRDQLLAELFSSPHPNYTPDGKRVFVTLNELDIDRWFA